MSPETPSAGEPRGLRAILAAALPKDRFGDHLTLLTGTGQNIAGLAVFVLASLGTNVLISRAFGRADGPAVLGLVTLATQLAFIGGAATRFGMDMATVRRVAIDIGKGEPGRIRSVMARAALIAAGVSAVAALAILLGAPALARAFGKDAPAAARGTFQAAALALPFVALSQVYLGGTRGLKIMRHTLTIYWVGQPVSWIVLMVLGWTVSKTAGMSVLAYAASWILATAAAWFAWRRETKPFGHLGAEPGEVRDLLRYGGPRAPAALLSQLLFWTDYFVLSYFVGHRTATSHAGLTAQGLGVYAAAVRVAQALVLFLIAVNYMFSPFVADLHARGERRRLDGLYKSLTRWTLAGTIPLLLLLVIVPGPVLLIFGRSFGSGVTALRILLIGQIVNVAVGSVGFILIMVGRTGWDLLVYAASFLLDLVLAIVLVPRFGPQGAAVAQAATLAASNALRLYLVWRFVHIQPFNRHYVRLAIPAAIAGGSMLVMHLLLVRSAASWGLDLVLTGLIGGVVYAAALVLTGLSPTEREAVSRMLARRGPPRAPTVES